MRRTKRFASFALAACVGVSLLVNVPGGTASAAEPEEVVTAEMSATETDAEALDENQETVYYTSSDADADGFVWNGTTLVKYVGKDKDVKIPDKCTSIGSFAFYGRSGLTSIEIPLSVTSIGEGAFGYCSGLTGVEIPSSVTWIGEQAFSNCSGLTSIKISSNVTSIDGWTFQYCTNLTSIEIPSSVTWIGKYAFFCCSGLTSIELPSSVMSIGDYAFQSCSGLTSIELPSSVTNIGKYAFNECKRLISIEIPSSVTSIGEGAFNACSGLTSIVISTENTKYNSEENSNAIIETETKKLILGCKNTKIPSSVTSIGEGAFNHCSDLTGIEIPTSVTSIGNYAFWGCSGLTGIEIPSSVLSIGKGAFYECSGLTNIEIPLSVTNIEDYEFDGCSSLTSIEIPSSVTSIGKYAFNACSSLTSIKIPSSVTSIDEEAFLNSGLKTIYGTSGSYAETFAKKNGYQFVDITVPTVTNVQAVAAGKNKVKVTWDKVSGATGYIVYARKNGKYAKLGVTAATSYTDTKALDNDYNFYFVYAYKKTAAGKIVTGKCQKYAYAKGTCMAVTNLKASSVKGGVKLTWTKSAGADGYIVYGKKTNFKYGYIGMTTKNTATSYTDTKADKGSYNFYWVFPYHYDKNGKRVIGPICGYVYGRAK